MDSCKGKKARQSMVPIVEGPAPSLLQPRKAWIPMDFNKKIQADVKVQDMVVSETKDNPIEIDTVNGPMSVPMFHKASEEDLVPQQLFNGHKASNFLIGSSSLAQDVSDELCHSDANHQVFSTKVDMPMVTLNGNIAPSPNAPIIQVVSTNSPLELPSDQTSHQVVNAASASDNAAVELQPDMQFQNSPNKAEGPQKLSVNADLLARRRAIASSVTIENIRVNLPDCLRVITRAMTKSSSAGNISETSESS